MADFRGPNYVRAKAFTLKSGVPDLLGRRWKNDHDLITTYHDLNPTTIPTLTSPPSPLEFLRHISRNTPFVLRAGASDFAACKKWSTVYLTTVMQDSLVNVAMTPRGNADSVIPLSSPDTTINSSSRSAIFVKPHETPLPFPIALTAIQSQEKQGSAYTGPTHYLQTQNDNLRHEYSTLFSDVPASIPWARIALGTEPDAINFWLGNSHSTTALHKDNYENIYVQVLGRKHFVLLPPVEAACVAEREVLAATYAVKHGDRKDIRKEDLYVKIDSPEEYVPFATWDPDNPSVNATPYSHLSCPLRVTLQEGDVLYLPALWYHKRRVLEYGEFY
ncbi:phospholipase A2 [Pyrenophora tritici-repentis Pt-1C-BFP]|uniref:Phospholipase A2 n=1 Tax=Pyrenophora tritici-repentis (strain Pt-1C-BFP) TaxID=426418 RepID=B2WJ25_PYRTR|nr:phospholipase A2 [Pyrenophora tritici-repentis Pt-1C-BFP]EDU43035.1 phospholipase A2 [Pyrenophora tritici-repentis Pt-1C-BFP]